MPLPAQITQNDAPRTRREARLRGQVPRPRAATASGTEVDAFDAAVRALTAAQPVQHRVVDDGVPAPTTALPALPASRAVSDHTVSGSAGAAPRRATRRASRAAGRRRLSVRRAAAASVTVGAVLAVGLLAVGMTLPAGTPTAPGAASALSTVAASAASGGGDAGIQAYVTSGNTGSVTSSALDRAGGFAASVIASAAVPADATSSGPSVTTVSGATGAAAQQAGTTGILNFSNAVFTNNRACPVQWPFAVGVPISWGFGPRPGEFHEGVDFTPGAGAHIQAIAAGTVVVAQSSYYGYGGAVMIDHVIDGQKVASLYGHLESGSIQVQVGQHVQVGQYIGNTGSTGYAFGANTHFEIRQNDVTPINPIPWLQAHNRC